MTRLVNRDRSLEKLEDSSWAADPSGGETRLMATVRALRRRPIGSLTVEDLRLLIRQDVGLAHLLPLAVDVLRADPLAVVSRSSRSRRGRLRPGRSRVVRP
ncbi:contact-dependent growth inhibition system immunity protein [Streptomyces sp. NPDC002309]